MKKDISFLIIVPTYNSYNDLKRLFVSITSQTFQLWRVLFIDGNSNYEHKKWIKQCTEDERFIVINEKQIKGIYPAMTQGVAYAKKNDWVIFMGSDDWFASPFSLKNIKEKIEDNTRDRYLSIVFYGTSFIHHKTRNIMRVNNVPFLKSANKRVFLRLLFLGYLPMHQSACFSSETIISLMPYDHVYKLAADCDLFFRLKLISDLRIIFIQKNLTNIQTGGISSKLTAQRISEVFKIYIKNYRITFLVPFLARYARKIMSRFFNLNI